MQHGCRTQLLAGPKLHFWRKPKMHSTRQLFVDAMSSSRAVEHAARAAAALALLKAANCEQQQRQHSAAHAGGGAAGGVGSSWAIETCAAFLQHLGCPSYCIPPPQPFGGSSSSSAPASPPPGSPKPPPYGPWSRYVLTCLGLRCLHDLDNGSCYGMPGELVRGLPAMVAPDRGNRTNPNIDEFERGALDLVRAACYRIETLACMVGLLKLALAPRRCGKGFQRVPSGEGVWASRVHGNGGRSSSSRPDQERAGVGAVEEGAWPVAGPGAARDIARRAVGWAVGVARGWAVEEERRAQVVATGGVRRGSAGVQLHYAALAGDEEQNLLGIGHQTVAVLAVQAVQLHYIALGCSRGDGGALRQLGLRLRRRWSRLRQAPSSSSSSSGRQGRSRRRRRRRGQSRRGSSSRCCWRRSGTAWRVVQRRTRCGGRLGRT